MAKRIKPITQQGMSISQSKENALIDVTMHLTKGQFLCMKNAFNSYYQCGSIVASDLCDFIDRAVEESTIDFLE